MKFYLQIKNSAIALYKSGQYHLIISTISLISSRAFEFQKLDANYVSLDINSVNFDCLFQNLA